MIPTLLARPEFAKIRSGLKLQNSNLSLLYLDDVDRAINRSLVILRLKNGIKVTNPAAFFFKRLPQPGLPIVINEPIGRTVFDAAIATDAIIAEMNQLGHLIRRWCAHAKRIPCPGDELSLRTGK